MRFIFICLLLATLSNLASCSELEDSSAPSTIKDSYLRTNTPTSLRAIDPNQLVLDMTINGERRRYVGSDYPDDRWVIELKLYKDTTSVIDLKWLAFGHLLRHEYGEFYVDSNNTEIELDLEFADEGTGPFDDDCDGESNLNELNNGTDPGVVSAEVCLLY